MNLVVAKSGAASVNNLPAVVKIPVSLLGAAGALGIFALWPGMMWHCVVVRKTTVPRKIGWMLLLLLTIPVGALIYYFLVFDRTFADL